MFKKKKPAHKEAFLGLSNDVSDVSDGDLEKELNSLIGRSSPRKNKIKKGKTDIDDEISIDSDDEKDILAELNDICDDEEDIDDNPQLISNVSNNSDTCNILNARLNAYSNYLAYLKSDPSQSSKVRRYQRQLDGIKSLLNDTKRGVKVDIESIPPEPPQIPQLEVTTSVKRKVNDSDVELLLKRNEEYKNALSKASNEGNSQRVAELNQVIKAFELELPKILDGESDFNPETDMPPPPEEFGNAANVQIDSKPRDLSPEKVADKPEKPDQPASKPKMNPVHQQLMKRFKEYEVAAENAKQIGNMKRFEELDGIVQIFKVEIPKIIRGEVPFDPDNDMPPPPEKFGSQQPVDPNLLSTNITIQTLTARSDYYKKMIEEAKCEGSTSKIRRYNRIVENYKEGIAALKSGAPFDFNDLPPPIGCQPLNIKSLQKSSQPAPSQPGPSTITRNLEPVLKPVSDQTVDKKVELLKRRQSEIKRAAIEAKKSNDLSTAKNYTAQYLLMNKMIEQAAMGNPIDLKSLPPAPNKQITKTAFVEKIITEDTCEAPLQFALNITQANNDREQICKVLTGQLESQLQLATEVQEAHEAAGNENISNELLSIIKVLNRSCTYIKLLKEKGQVPNYQFKIANLPILNYNLNVPDDCLEITVVKCVSLPCTEKIKSMADLEIYVSLEFSYPSTDKPQKHATDWQKYSQTDEEQLPNGKVMFEINRKNRSYLRTLNNKKSLKATVFFKRGLFKSNGELGSAYVPMEDLQSCATIEKSCELFEGRKAVGGAVIVRIKQRTPLGAEKLNVEMKPWLMVDLPATAVAKIKQDSDSLTSDVPKSIKVLQFEHKYLKEEIIKLKSKLTRENLEKLTNRLQEIESQHNSLKNKLSSDINFRKQYIVNLPAVERFYHNKVIECHNQGNEMGVKLNTTKKNLVTEERKSYLQ